MHDDYEDNEAQMEISKERQEYQDNLNRSEEDGWFYSDEDGGADE